MKKTICAADLTASTKIEKILNFETGKVEEFEIEKDPFEQIAGIQTEPMAVKIPKNHQILFIGDTENLVADEHVLDFLKRHQIEPQI